MASPNYNPSIMSRSTTWSFFKPQQTQPLKKEKASLRQRIKQALKDVGHPPTYRFDLDNPKAKKPVQGFTASSPFTNRRRYEI